MRQDNMRFLNFELVGRTGI